MTKDLHTRIIETPSKVFDAVYDWGCYNVGPKLDRITDKYQGEIRTIGGIATAFGGLALTFKDEPVLGILVAIIGQYYAKVGLSIMEYKQNKTILIA